MKKIFILILSIFSIGCNDDFLDVAPDINTNITITEIEHLNRLYNNVGRTYVTSYPTFFCTDNAFMPQSVIDESTSFSQELQDQYLFNTEIKQNSDQAWSGNYRNLLLPALVLEYLDKGELKGDDEVLKTALRAESHFYIAYYHFELATIYALHPKGNDTEPGIVIRKTTSYTEDQTRATLKETFDFIKAEIDEALKFPATMAKGNIFRINLTSVHAFAARFYLYIGDFAKAKTHADEALKGYNFIYDLNNMTFTSTAWYWSKPVLPITVTYSSDYLEKIGGEYYYSRNANAYWNTSPSQELMDLYDTNDIRKKYFIKDFFERYGVKTNKWYSFLNGPVGDIYSGPSTAEMYLIRAECKARANDISGAMADVEMVRVKRFAPANYAALPIPGTAKATVKVVVDERRREDPFEYRFTDLKRLNNNDSMFDPITITRVLSGKTTEIKPNDRRYARPIGKEVIILSDGATVQNTY